MKSKIKSLFLVPWSPLQSTFLAYNASCIGKYSQLKAYWVFDKKVSNEINGDIIAFLSGGHLIEPFKNNSTRKGGIFTFLEEIDKTYILNPSKIFFKKIEAGVMRTSVELCYHYSNSCPEIIHTYKSSNLNIKIEENL